MTAYIAKRLLGLLPTLVLVGFLVFLLVHLLPGDPARLAAGQDATPETVELVRKDLGLDKPLPRQFLRFVTPRARPRLRPRRECRTATPPSRLHFARARHGRVRIPGSRDR